MFKNISAELIYDGVTFCVPERLGVAREDQLQGTTQERLSELAGRACYDSLGKGRNTVGYHDHIREVGHRSVYEHPNVTVLIEAPTDRLGMDPYIPVYNALILSNFVNRPGTWVREVGPGQVRATLNFRAILEWARWSRPGDYIGRGPDLHLELAVLMEGQLTEKMMLRPDTLLADRASLSKRALMSQNSPLPTLRVRRVEPNTDEECWVTMLLCGSRGMSHELVRHGDFTAISQRSTRYVDEADSQWVEHPLLTARHAPGAVSEVEAHIADNELSALACDVVSTAQLCYRATVTELERWLTQRGIDKSTARKQARGAARNYLGNGLYTEVVFSANVAQWKRMLTLRAAPPADAEIRKMFCQALGVLKSSAVADRFTGWTLGESPDGLGQVACISEEVSATLPS